MSWLQNMIFGFAFSFIGSIPPGSINLTVIQLSLRHQAGAAFRLGLAAAIVEFAYAAIAIKFQLFITSTPGVQENFQLIAASVLILLGILSFLSVRKKTKKQTSSLTDSGFRKGILISLANPLAMPFWIAVTAYLQSNRWISFDDISIWTYVWGISIGTLALLSLFALAAYRVSKFVRPDNRLIKIIPGIVLVSLGTYSLLNLYLM